MKNAIDDYLISGIETTLDFCRYVIEHPAFVSGDFDTNFVENHYKGLPDELTVQEKEMAAVAAVFHLKESKQVKQLKARTTKTNWRNRFYN